MADGSQPRRNVRVIPGAQVQKIEPRRRVVAQACPVFGPAAGIQPAVFAERIEPAYEEHVRDRRFPVWCSFMHLRHAVHDAVRKRPSLKFFRLAPLDRFRAAAVFRFFYIRQSALVLEVQHVTVFAVHDAVQADGFARRHKINGFLGLPGAFLIKLQFRVISDEPGELGHKRHVFTDKSLERLVHHDACAVPADELLGKEMLEQLLQRFWQIKEAPAVRFFRLVPADGVFKRQHRRVCQRR